MADDRTPADAINPPATGLPTEPPSGHVYDGIGALNNPLPGWWKWVFIGTIAVSAPYYAYYHFGGVGRSLPEQYEVALAENSRLMFAQMGDLGDDTASLVHAMEQPSLVSIGRSVFQSHCVSCHGPQGGGLIGPNLTDDVYKNVRELGDVVRVVREGAAAGAMPAWKGRLDANEIILVAVYVAALRGTSPTGSAKGPEGREIEPWPAAEEFPEPSDQDGDAGGSADDADRSEDEQAAPVEQPTAGLDARSRSGDGHGGPQRNATRLAGILRLVRNG